MSVQVRYFAAARAASGLDEEKVGAGPVETLLFTLASNHGPELEKVLARCSYLLDGVAVTDQSTAASDGSTLDILPPFAGG